MRQHPENQWFHSSEFLRAATVVHQVATTEHTRHLGFFNCKYLQFRIDQRTGDFIILDRNGVRLDSESIYKMFPELRD